MGVGAGGEEGIGLHCSLRNKRKGVYVDVEKKGVNISPGGFPQIISTMIAVLTGCPKI